MTGHTRRALLGGALGLAGLASLPAAARADGAACGAPTPRQTEGPFFRPDSPLVRNLRAGGEPGRPLELACRLLDRDCRPLPGAIVELWHADDGGRYDNAGFRLRGHQVTDPDGRFGFETIVPGLYPGRTRHYHLILAPGGGRPLTTQLYFPDEPRNARDRIFDPALLLRLETRGQGLLGRFDFVVA